MSNLETITAADLIVDANVRTDGVEAEDLKSLRESIAARGVLQPLVGWRDADGGVHVQMGQRRALVASDLGIDVPVLVHDAEPENVDRIVDQWVENEARAGLTNKDRATAAAQLALEGLSDTKIGKAVGMKRAEVKAARTVAESEAVVEHANSLTLEQGAALAEFEGDAETLAALIEVAHEQPGRLDHAIARARNDRDEAEAVRVLAEELTEQGLEVNTEHPYDSGLIPLGRLRDSEGNKIDAEAHAQCPARVWNIRSAPYDWNEQEDTDPHATVGGETVIAVETCSDPAAGGHVDVWAGAQGTPQKKTADQMTDEEREAASAARREVIENNKAWDAATEVRQAWVKEFAARKTPPKGHEKVLLACTAHYDYGLKAAHEAVSWLGWDLNAEMKGATPKRLAQIHTAICLARWETTDHRNAWRARDRAGQMMLTAMGEWGYELSEVEVKARDLKK